MKYDLSLDELEKRAVKWWPDDLKKNESNASIIPTLIASQDEFLSILLLSKGDPIKLFKVLEASEMPANLFVKHLAILADFGGEPLGRLGKDFGLIFTTPQAEKAKMIYVSGGVEQSYQFVDIQDCNSLGNSKLKIDGKGLLSAQTLSDLYRDVIMILLFGGAATNAEGGGLEKCEVGSVLDDPEALKLYVSQKYIWVSRITGGASANSQGQIAEKTVRDHLSAKLGDKFTFSGGAIKLDGYPKEGGMPFDIIVRNGNKAVGIEVSFQVTTNSTIERKAGLAEDRQRLMHTAGHKVAYVLDGSGNFQRRSAASRICQFSDCTVAFSNEEFNRLAEFIKDALK